MWFIGVEVEQEMSAPPPKKNPGSAPVRGKRNLSFPLVKRPKRANRYISRLRYSVENVLVYYFIYGRLLIIRTLKGNKKVQVIEISSYQG